MHGSKEEVYFLSEMVRERGMFQNQQNGLIKLRVSKLDYLLTLSSVFTTDFHSIYSIANPLFGPISIIIPNIYSSIFIAKKQNMLLHNAI